MSKNTLFSYFSKSPAAARKVTSPLTADDVGDQKSKSPKETANRSRTGTGWVTTTGRTVGDVNGHVNSQCYELLPSYSYVSKDNCGDTM